jgi:CubicO group peptidase (beta-lactamase class C family)
VISGYCEPGYGAVADAFRANFERGLEVGAACAVYVDGRPVVDLWGGLADARTGRPWVESTPACVFSVTKALVAMLAYRLVEAGQLDLDAPVATYWPEFAGAGKGAITVRQVMSHRAGLPLIESRLTFDEVLAWDPPVRSLAAQAPLWEPGTAHMYHAWTYGWLVGELVRRITGLTPGQFWRHEFGEPLGLQTWIGLPESEMDSVARTELPRDMADRPPLEPMAERAGTINGAIPFPGVGPDMTFNLPAIRRAELPGGNGISTARSVAKAFAACIGEVDGMRLLSDASLDDALIERSAGREWNEAPDEDGPRWGTGFMLASPPWQPMLGPRSFGHSGAGGQLAFADPDRGLAFAYVANQMGPLDDMRAKDIVAPLDGGA